MEERDVCVVELVKQARTLSAADYVAWCAAPDGLRLQTAHPNFFGVSMCQHKGRMIAELDQFYWPDQPATVRSGHVIGWRVPGAYIEEYNILAVGADTDTGMMGGHFQLN